MTPPVDTMRFAHEAAAIKAIQTIQTMQVQYTSQYGRFAMSLTELGPPASGAANASSAGLIDSGLAAGEKSGYKFSMTGNQGGYQISAAPVAYGSNRQTHVLFWPDNGHLRKRRPRAGHLQQQRNEVESLLV